MINNKSIVLQVDESTRLLMDEISNKISDDIIGDLDALKQGIESATESLKSIERESRKIDKIQQALLELNGSGLTSVLQPTLLGIQRQNENLQKSIDNSKKLVESIKTSVESDKSQELLSGIQDRVGTINRSLESFAVGTAQSIGELSKGILQQAKDIPSIVEGIHSLQSSIESVWKLLGTIGDREKKMEEKVLSMFDSQKESQAMLLRILYNTTSIWKRKLRKQLKQLCYELERNN